MYDASEIGLDWKGSLESLSSVPGAKCSYIAADGRLKDHTGKVRGILQIDDTVIDSTMGKLSWAKGADYTDYLVKRSCSQAHSKQEAIIQWLCYKSLASHGLEAHCPRVFDIFTFSKSIWFSMSPIYKAPVLDVYLKTLPRWRIPHPSNGEALLKIVSQIAMCCFVLERAIGFNHRDLKPNNILVKLDSVQTHLLKWSDDLEIQIASSPTAVLVDFGFSCLGPGKSPWLQAGDDVLSPFDACPRVGRDIFMLIVFLIWQNDVQASLTEDHMAFLKSSLRLSTERWQQLIQLNKNPSDWIYILITERGFQCPALDPATWLQSCASRFPEVVSIRSQSRSNTVS